MNKIRLFVLSLAAMIGWATFGAIAYAVDAATTTALNLRSGPGTSYGVIDVLSSGEIVSIVECQGSWCYVSQADGGPSGWVSSNYLTTAPDAPAPDDPDCSFALTFGPGGPSLSIVCGDADIPVPVPTPTPTPPRACLYKNTNYGGGGVCYGPGTINQLGANMNDKTSSVKLQGGATVRLCVNANLGGFCRNVTTNEAALGGLLNNRVSSIRVYAGAAPAPVPRACLYTNTNFGGTGVCYGVGTTNALAGNMNDKASSIRLQAGATARVCVNNNLGGFCRNVTGNEAAFGPFLNNRISSIRVYSGAPPAPPAPVTHSTGSIDLPQTWRANLDNGNVGGAGADIWFHAVNAVTKFLEVQNGAQFAVGDRSNRGFAGCSAESYNSNPIPLATLPVGSYVCVRTNQGRISQFRLNGYQGTTMKLGYTTWAN